MQKKFYPINNSSNIEMNKICCGSNLIYFQSQTSDRNVFLRFQSIKIITSFLWIAVLVDSNEKLLIKNV